MRVLGVATHEQTGAGRAAVRIHAALATAGAASRLLVLHGRGADAGIDVLGRGLAFLAADLRNRAELALLSLQRGGEPGFRSLGLGGPGLAHINADSADGVHLHWIPGMLGIADLPAIRKPVVWTFHDAWPFCGAEHYTTLGRPRAGYEPGNRAPGARGPDLDRWTWRRKQAHWRGFAPVIVCPSRWLADEARASVLFGGREVHVVPNPVDTALYRPQDRAQARVALGLPQDRLLIVFGAQRASEDRRKGFHVLEEALGSLAARGHAARTDLVVFGAAGSGPVRGFNTHWMGIVDDEARMSQVYAACDLFALPSLQDNYPNTLVEAMACGLPPAASRVGGVPDLVQAGETGLLAAPGDAMQFAGALETLLTQPDLRARLGAAARRAIEAQCDPQLVGRRYLEIHAGAKAAWRPA
jgi:glycosyltransferase involved in cell wall biosynthesis